ncbi:hypothetical protein [Pseudomonas frederiksbergensis]|uniref:hypothetical protein n=1 Tax=Pseudomonas frederiksbergensis TaxID=104087 RepID=UPI003D1E7BC1
MPAADLKVVRSKSALLKYSFGQPGVEHFFCGNCGIYTHHRRSTNPHEFKLASRRVEWGRRACSPMRLRDGRNTR